MSRHIIFCLLLLVFNSIFQIPPALSQRRQTLERPQRKRQAAKIYLAKELKEGAPFNPKNPGNLHPVIRMVDRVAPLRPTLEALLAGPNTAEEARGYINISFGIKLVRVKIKNGTVRADFTMPPAAAFSGDNSPFLFKDAVELTIQQFPGVKKVIVCLDGDENFWSESEEPPKKCPAL
jgi:spore germination protein GerM